jgi:hypothetical protein
MNAWAIRKNKLDLDYQRELQKYQVLLASKWVMPLTILGLIV